MPTDSRPDGPVLVYGVVSALHRGEPGGPGVRGHLRFELVVHGQVGAVVSILEEASDATPDDLRTYLRVLDDVRRRTTVLPMRFGMVFDSVEEVAERLLAPREDMLAGLLRRMEGMVEVRVRATLREEPVLEHLMQARADLRQLQQRMRGRPENATYYDRIELGRRVAEEMTALAARDARVIEARLGDQSAAVSPGDPPLQRQVTNASYLLPSTDVPRFIGAVDTLRDELGAHLDLRVSEPMPPFSFADMELDAIPAGGR